MSLRGVLVAGLVVLGIGEVAAQNAGWNHLNHFDGKGGHSKASFHVAENFHYPFGRDRYPHERRLELLFALGMDYSIGILGRDHEFSTDVGGTFVGSERIVFVKTSEGLFFWKCFGVGTLQELQMTLGNASGSMIHLFAGGELTYILSKNVCIIGEIKFPFGESNNGPSIGLGAQLSLE